MSFPVTVLFCLSFYILKYVVSEYMVIRTIRLSAFKAQEKIVHA